LPSPSDSGWTRSQGLALLPVLARPLPRRSPIQSVSSIFPAVV